MKDLFFELADAAVRMTSGREVLLINFAAETSDFVRLNRARVRQPMTVRQAYLKLTLIDGQRHTAVTLALTGDPAQDHSAIAELIATLRADLPHLPEDPYLLYSIAVHSSARVDAGQLPTAQEALDTILRAAHGTDLVGMYASGPVYRGFANSLGQRNWHAVDSFNFEWSLVHSEDKAVKSAYAAARWQPAALEARMQAARAQLEHLARPAKTIAPGAYRAYLAPAAVDELLWMLNWNGVSAKAQRTKQSSIQKLVDGELTLSPRLNMRENTIEGLMPAFDEAGFVKPGAVELIRAGRHAGSLVSPRTAQEYAIAANGASEDESMGAMDVQAGNLPMADVLAALDTGVWVGNLHYLNYSDRPHARITGMTRFASFWVERGTLVAPLNVMRFDDSLYRMLGEHLLDFTQEREWIVNAGTYGQRSIETSRVPGALLGALSLTL